MSYNFCHFLILCTLATSLPATEDKETLHIAAIDWCPQLCSSQNAEGYILDLVRNIYSDSPYELSVKMYPWSRALTMAQRGQVDAVLSPAKAEAPHLLYPENEVGMQRMCFFTGAESKWQYRSIADLKGKQFGLATDTSVEELSAYLSENPQQFQLQPYHERYILQQARKVKLNRIDAFLFTYNSTVFELEKHGIREQFRSAGCVSNAHVYMAFSPNKTISNRIKPMMALFDQRMETIKKKNQIEKVMHKYGLEDWRHLNSQ